MRRARHGGLSLADKAWPLKIVDHFCQKIEKIAKRLQKGCEKSGAGKSVIVDPYRTHTLLLHTSFILFTFFTAFPPTMVSPLHHPFWLLLFLQYSNIRSSLEQWLTYHFLELQQWNNNHRNRH